MGVIYFPRVTLKFNSVVIHVNNVKIGKGGIPMNSGNNNYCKTESHAGYIQRVTKRATLLFLVIFILANLSLSAQVRMGIIGGMNFADATQKNLGVSDLAYKSTYGIGGIVEVNLHKGLSLYLEPMYIEKGVNVELFLPISPVLKLNLSYFEIPIFLKYEVGNKFSPYILAGSTIGFNLSSSIEAELLGIELMTDTEALTEEIDVGLSFGGGINYSFDLISLFIEGRYTLGLTNIVNTNPFNVSVGPLEIQEEIRDDINIKTKGFQIMAGFSVPILE